MKAVVAALGIFALFPLLHFLPIRWKARNVMSGEVSNLKSAEEGAGVLPVTGPSDPVYSSPLALYPPVSIPSRPGG